MLPVKEEIPNNNLEEDSTINTTTSIPMTDPNPLYEVVGQCEAAGPRSFEAQESLAGLKANLTSSRDHFSKHTYIRILLHKALEIDL